MAATISREHRMPASCDGVRRGSESNRGSHIMWARLSVETSLALCHVEPRVGNRAIAADVVRVSPGETETPEAIASRDAIARSCIARSALAMIRRADTDGVVPDERPPGSRRSSPWSCRITRHRGPEKHRNRASAVRHEFSVHPRAGSRCSSGRPGLALSWRSLAFRHASVPCVRAAKSATALGDAGARPSRVERRSGYRATLASSATAEPKAADRREESKGDVSRCAPARQSGDTGPGSPRQAHSECDRTLRHRQSVGLSAAP
jgi:hypothetical protein